MGIKAGKVFRSIVSAALILSPSRAFAKEPLTDYIKEGDVIPIVDISTCFYGQESDDVVRRKTAVAMEESLARFTDKARGLLLRDVSMVCGVKEYMDKVKELRAYYISSNETIIIRPDLYKDSRFADVITHEFLHHIYDRVMPLTARHSFMEAVSYAISSLSQLSKRDEEQFWNYVLYLTGTLDTFTKTAKTYRFALSYIDRHYASMVDSRESNALALSLGSLVDLVGYGEPMSQAVDDSRVASELYAYMGVGGIAEPFVKFYEGYLAPEYIGRLTIRSNKKE
ncbi:MAG: hypothetical protein D6769_02860 [Methanobacteriota archaeon]|nr:MAG: hypothetical protein D6769_02860 [Euryarchaeota archaeon]